MRVSKKTATTERNQALHIRVTSPVQDLLDPNLGGATNAFRVSAAFTELQPYTDIAFDVIVSPFFPDTLDA